MRILLSTTLGHNPGDELIADGVKALLEYAYPNQPKDYILYNRNPDLQWEEERFALVNQIGNYQAGTVDLSYIDLVVLAGSPEWTGGPMRALYEALEKTPRPFFALGIGQGDSSLQLRDLDINILSKAEKIITRSTETTELLKKYGIKSQALVCPAFFSSYAIGNASKKSELLQIVQAPGIGWHEISRTILEGITSDDLGCVHIKELKFFSRYPNKLRYAANSDEFRKKFQFYKRVHSTRLHGAIGTLAMGIPSVVVTRGDFRIETAAKMFGKYLPIAKNFSEAAELTLPSSLEIQDLQDYERGRWLEALRT